LFLGKERKKERKKYSGKDGGGDATSQAKADNTTVFYWLSRKEGSAISIFHLLFFQMNLNYGR